MDTSERLLLLQKCSNTTAPINPACPALAPPDGELPLDSNAISLWSIALGVLISCCVLIGLSVALHTFTRVSIVQRSLALEDALMIFAAATFVPIFGLQLKAYHYGGSKHQWNVTIGELFKALRYVYAVQVLYCLALYAAKLGILLQIKHIFEGTHQRKAFVYWASWALIVLTSCAYISTLMVLVFSCNPVRKAWNPVLPGKCHNSAAGYLSGTVNLISDIAVLLLPIIGVSRLQMDTRRKVAVSAVFATGAIACGVSALRLVYSTREAKSADKTYWLALVGLSGSVEIAVVILCGCFTSFPKFVKWMKGERTGSQRYGSQRHGSRRYGPQQYGSEQSVPQRCESRSFQSDSQSRLKHDAFIELGKFDFGDVFGIVRDDWRTLR